MKIVTLMENTAACDGLYAEHGLSLYIEACGHKILFDAGQTGLFSENAALMGVDLQAVDMAILSHGHYDHSGGFMRFFALNDHAPLYLNERAFADCWHGEDYYIGVEQSLKSNERLVLTGDEFGIGEGLTLYTMNAAPRRHPSSGTGLTIRRPDGSFVPDDFLHEHYLMIEEEGKRVLISGCSHKGILNIVEWLEPDVLVGGFHFMKLDPIADAETLAEFARALMKYPAEYYTCHCTGVSQYGVLKGIMGERLHYLAAGTRIEL